VLHNPLCAAVLEINNAMILWNVRSQCDAICCRYTHLSLSKIIMEMGARAMRAPLFPSRAAHTSLHTAISVIRYARSGFKHQPHQYRSLQVECSRCLHQSANLLRM
jgi:hypothetical protein